MILKKVLKVCGLLSLCLPLSCFVIDLKGHYYSFPNSQYHQNLKWISPKRNPNLQLPQMLSLVNLEACCVTFPKRTLADVLVHSWSWNLFCWHYSEMIAGCYAVLRKLDRSALGRVMTHLDHLTMWGHIYLYKKKFESEEEKSPIILLL